MVHFILYYICTYVLLIAIINHIIFLKSFSDICKHYICVPFFSIAFAASIVITLEMSLNLQYIPFNGYLVFARGYFIYILTDDDFISARADNWKCKDYTYICLSKNKCEYKKLLVRIRNASNPCHLSWMKF